MSFTAAATDELSAPQSLMKYPPLAYLVNALLGCLNFLRECPLLTVSGGWGSVSRNQKTIFRFFLRMQVRDDVLQILGSFVGEICAFLCDQKLTIRNLGKKYFGDGYMRENLGQKPSKGLFLLFRHPHFQLKWIRLFCAQVQNRSRRRSWIIITRSP